MGKKMNGQLQVKMNGHFGGSKSVSAADMWRNEEDEDDGMDIDLDAYVKKKPTIGKKRESKVKFAPQAQKEINKMISIADAGHQDDGNDSEGSVVYHSNSRPGSTKHANGRPKSSKHATTQRPKSSKHANGNRPAP